MKNSWKAYFLDFLAVLLFFAVALVRKTCFLLLSRELNEPQN